jgi:hypothetical protein
MHEFTINGKKGKKLICRTISAEGPESLYFIERTGNSEAYIQILEECIPDID